MKPEHCRIKSRQQYVAAKLQGSPPRVLDLARATIQREGALALWNGVGPSVLRVSGGVGLYFSVLHHLLAAEKGTGRQTEENGHAATASSQRTFKSATALWAGGTARAISCTAMHPISVVKSRMETYRTHGYAGSFEALRTIARTEGVGGLYAGLGAALLRDVPYSAAYICFYHQLLSLYVRLRHQAEEGTRLPLSVTFASGLVAGLGATVVSHPFDVVKTRLQLDRLEHPTKGVLGRLLGVVGVLQHVLRTEGFRGIWRGLPLRMLRRPLQTALTWSVYGLFAGDQGVLGVLSGRPQ